MRDVAQHRRRSGVVLEADVAQLDGAAERRRRVGLVDVRFRRRVEHVADAFEVRIEQL